MFPADGFVCHKQAASPANTGDENEVPFPFITVLLALAITVCEPCAHTFGFPRPSTEGPRELKATTALSAATAPMANTESASAGAPISCHGAAPELPALFTTTIPFRAAIFPAR